VSAAVPRRIAFIFVSMPVGGAEDFALAVAPRLAPDFEAHFVCLRSLGVLGEEAAAAGRPVHLVPVFPGRWVARSAVRRLADWLTANRIQLVHSQIHHAHVFATRAARMAGIPCVVHQQKTLAPLPWRKRRVFRACLRRADRVVALSEETRAGLERLAGLDPSVTAVVPNAIDTEVFRPSADRAALRKSLGLPEGFLAGTVASLHPVKNHDLIIEALGILGPEARAIFVGEGPAREALADRAAACGLEDRVIFAGRQRPVLPWLQSLDLFVLASRWEGQPLALLQALACGVPVLTSAIEGNIAVLGRDYPGLFDPDDAGRLAALIRAVRDGGPQRTAMLENSKNIRVPSATDAAAQLAELYASLLR
jgi:glycosyltransferase involved in cell wall biosynthesis